jgi:cell division protein FtsZ
MNIIYEQVDEQANIVLGSVIDDALEDDLRITLIATGFAPIVSEYSQVGYRQKTNASYARPVSGMRAAALDNTEAKKTSPITTRTQPIESAACDMEGLTLLDPLDMPAILRQKNTTVSQEQE